MWECVSRFSVSDFVNFMKKRQLRSCWIPAWNLLLVCLLSMNRKREEAFLAKWQRTFPDHRKFESFAGLSSRSCGSVPHSISRDLESYLCEKGFSSLLTMARSALSNQRSSRS